jgi:hypothetical protein
MPKLPVLNPTTILRLVIAIAARTELPATERFSARMEADEYGMGESDICRDYLCCVALASNSFP